MKKLAILLVFAFVVTMLVGCETTKRTTDMNMKYLGDDTMRALGFDQPSQLHPRDNVSSTMYEPYRPYK